MNLISDCFQAIKHKVNYILRDCDDSPFEHVQIEQTKLNIDYFYLIVYFYPCITKILPGRPKNNSKHFSRFIGFYIYSNLLPRNYHLQLKQPPNLLPHTPSHPTVSKVFDMVMRNYGNK